MTVNKMSHENLTENKRMLYALTRGENRLVKDLSDSENVTPVCWVEFHDTNARGEEHDVLAVMTEEVGVVSTISETFKREFYDMWYLMDGETFQFHTVHGTTKAGREYVTCTMVIE